MASAGSVLGGAAGGALSGLKFGPWGATAGAALGGLGGLFGGNSAADSASNAIFKNVPNLINQGNTDVGTGVSRLNQAGNFFSTILGGNKEAINNLIAPQVSTVMSQYDNAANNIRQFAPRGGGSTAALAALPFAKATAAQGAYQGILPGAAQGEAAVGGATAGVGENLLGNATGAGSTAFDYSKLAQQQQQALGAGIGQSTASGAGTAAGGSTTPTWNGSPVPGVTGGGSAIPDIVNAGKSLGGYLAKMLTGKFNFGGGDN